MLCIQTSALMSNPNRMKYASNQFYFKTREEMERMFPEDTGALDATVAIAERCHATIDLGNLASHFPAYDLPEGVATPKDLLVKLGREGMQRIYGIADFDNPRDAREKMLVERFAYEADVRQDQLQQLLPCRRRLCAMRAATASRRSRARFGRGVDLAYALDITQIDPIRFDLIFERFLNPERVSPPDFDIASAKPAATA